LGSPSFRYPTASYPVWISLNAAYDQNKLKLTAKRHTFL
jgi:hypothetical protein